MFEIKYNLAHDEAEMIEIDEAPLRTRHFLGNLTLKNERSCIFIDHQEVPVVDSAFNILRICMILSRKKNGTQDVEFPSSGKKLTFQKDRGRVKIIPSFSAVTLEVPADDFKEGAKHFFQNIVVDVMKKNQSLKMNAVFFGYLCESEKI
jgi:hypothetical protein